MTAYFTPEDRETVTAIVLPALQTQGRWEGILNFSDFRSGVPLPVLYNVFAVRDDDGVAEGYGIVARDLREVRVAATLRTALFELGDRLRDMEDVFEMPFIAAKIMGRALGVSSAGYATLDADEKTIAVERDWFASGKHAIPGQHRLFNHSPFIDGLRQGAPIVVNDVRLAQYKPSDTGWLGANPARACIYMPLIEQGRLVAFFFVNSAEPQCWMNETLGFIRNVAERTRVAIERCRAEQSLRQLTSVLEQQVEDRTRERDRLWGLSRDPFLIADRAGRWLSVNPAWTEILGWSEAELLGCTSEWMEHPDDHSKTRAEVKRLARSEATLHFENRFRAKGGDYHWFSWTATAVEERLYCVARDITVEKAQSAAREGLEEQLRQSQKMEAIGQLTGGLAHDFNNLLTGITGSLELLQARVEQGRLDNLDRYLNAALLGSQRAAVLTHRLLAFSRRQTLDPKPTDVSRLATDMVELIQRMVGPEIKVETVVGSELWATLVDASQLENALLNLSINARDAMPNGGRLTIETRNKTLDARAAQEKGLQAGQYVTLCVSDTGTGMAPEVIERAFDPFFTTKPIGEGTGLGLSMTYGFARQSGGQVHISSEIGQGSVVCLYLPRHHVVVAAADASIARAAAPRAVQNETVLIIDDEPSLRMLITEVLDDLGYIAIEAADGRSGLEVLQSDVHIDLLVTDVGLPGGLNGRQVADAARVARPELKVLFITGYAENAVLSHGQLGSDMHILPKPFTMDALAIRIKNLITTP